MNLKGVRCIKRMTAKYLLPLAVLFSLSVVQAETVTDLKSWKVDGTVVLDPNKPGPDGSPSIRVEPKSKAILPLRAEDGSGKLTLFIYDDGTVAVPDQKKTVGPRWGFIQKDGRVFVGGLAYAQYLAAGGSLCIMDQDPNDKGGWGALKFVSPRGTPGWRKWAFEYNPETGLKISIDDKPLEAKFFDWNATKAVGFTGLILYGDSTEAGSPQTIWVGGLNYELGPPMKVVPTWKPVAAAAPRPSWVAALEKGEKKVTPFPGPTLVDDVLGPDVKLLPNYASGHPRLLFSASDLPELQRKAKDYPKLWDAVIAQAKRTNYGLPTPDLIEKGPRYFEIPCVESAALAWFVTGDKAYRDGAVKWLLAYCRVPVWGTGFHANCDLQASWYLYHLAIAYDILYKDLTDEERKVIREGLAGHAKVIYDDFDPSLNKKKLTYDQNHLYTPAVALAAASLALLDDVPEAKDWLKCASAILKRCRYVLNEDGYYYEAYGYWSYSLHWHVRYADLMSRATGEKLYALPALRDNWLFGLHLSLPGAPWAFEVGDTGFWKKDNERQEGYSLNYSMFWNIARENKSAENRTVGDLYASRHAESDRPASAFLWFNPQIQPAELDEIKPYHRFADQDVVTWRSSWKPDATCYYFRCGPPLGHSATAKLNQLQDWEMNAGHVHPDIGGFYIYAKGTYLAVTTGYTVDKWTRDHNTLLIDGKGQALDGDYHHYKRFPYDKLDKVRIDSCYLGNDYGYASGEMGSVYSKSPDLQLRRSVLMTERWMLTVDDMAGTKDHQPTWICHSDGEFQAQGAAFIAKQQNASLAVIPLSEVSEKPTLEKSIVSAGRAPGQGHPEQHGYHLTLTAESPAKDLRLIHLLVPLGKDQTVPEVKSVNRGKDSLQFQIVWGPGKTEDVTLDLKWQGKEDAKPGPAKIVVK